jgi:hypothetical protein
VSTQSIFDVLPGVFCSIKERGMKDKTDAFDCCHMFCSYGVIWHQCFPKPGVEVCAVWIMPSEIPVTTPALVAASVLLGLDG